MQTDTSNFNQAFIILMILNQLFGRLKTVSLFIPRNSIFADIGCDHGLLSVGVSNHCKHIWAIDVSPLAIQGTVPSLALLFSQ